MFLFKFLHIHRWEGAEPDDLNNQIHKLMAYTKEQFDQLKTDINDATNAIAARIDALQQSTVPKPGLTEDEETAVYDEFAALSAQLKALGTPDATQPETPVEPAS